MKDRATEIAWDFEGRYVGDGRGAPLDKTKRIRRKRLHPVRAHHCLPRFVFKRAYTDPQSLTVPWPEGSGCGVFICSKCRQPTPWCMGGSDVAQSRRCDRCWRATEAT
jgi:hypothetical protein